MSKLFHRCKHLSGRTDIGKRLPRRSLWSFPATTVSRYSDTVLLESGWIRGGDLIADQPAIVEVDHGNGYIDLIAFGVQRRGQPHSTFRILFNAIQRSTLKSVEMEDEAKK